MYDVLYKIVILTVLDEDIDEEQKILNQFKVNELVITKYCHTKLNLWKFLWDGLHAGGSEFIIKDIVKNKKDIFTREQILFILNEQ